MMMSPLSSRRASVSLLFATALVPLMMLVGLAIDFGFYNEAQTQLDMAADASALHAARVAVQLLQLKDAAYLNKGKVAGEKWFVAQEGAVPQAKLGSVHPDVSVTFDANTKEISAQVTFTGVILTHFAGFFPASWPQYPNWGIAGAATAVISTSTFSEFDFMVDNSSSMLIASSPTDIQRMEKLTPCSTQAAAVQANGAQPLFSSYSWFYDATGAHDNNSRLTPPDALGTPIPYGYGIFQYTATSGPNTGKTEYINDILPLAMTTGECDPRFTGSVAAEYDQECFYVPGQTTAVPNPLLYPPIDPNTHLCTNGGGGVSTQLNSPAPQLTDKTNTITVQNVPQAPCAFACHTDTSKQTTAADYNDYYGLARKHGVSLRFDVIKNALTAQTATQDEPIGVIPLLETYVQNTGNLNPVTVGVYYFNSDFVPRVSPDSGETSLSELQAAEKAELDVEPKAVHDNADTDMPGALIKMFDTYKAAGPVGNGSTRASPNKFLFLITDGLEDFADSSGVREQGPLGTISLGGTNSLDRCKAIKALGVKIYVLYTTYYPLPNPYYLDYDQKFAQPTGNTSAIYQALEQCASPGTTADPTILEATDGAEIGIQLNKLVESALSAPGRLSN